MTDNNVRIHLEPTPRHTYAVYALARARSQCTAKDRVGRFDGSYADCLLVSFRFILFHFISFCFRRVTFLCALSWHRMLYSRFSTLVWHISRCPISMFAPL